MMDNIIIEKIYSDSDLIELRVNATCKYVSALQCAYIQRQDLESISQGILRYTLMPNRECYFEFGNKNGNYTPAFSLNFLPSDKNGHILIDVDLEIDDNPDRRHRCQFFVRSEIGSVERFAKKLIHLSVAEKGNIVQLHEE